MEENSSLYLDLNNGNYKTDFMRGILHSTKYIDERSYKTLSAKCTSLRVMLIASCKTAKENVK